MNKPRNRSCPLLAGPIYKAAVSGRGKLSKHLRFRAINYYHAHCATCVVAIVRSNCLGKLCRIPSCLPRSPIKNCFILQVSKPLHWPHKSAKRRCWSVASLRSVCNRSATPAQQPYGFSCTGKAIGNVASPCYDAPNKQVIRPSW